MSVTQAPAVTVPPQVTEDFWRTPAPNGAQPNGTTDVTESIARTGQVGIGQVGGAQPAAMVDVQTGGVARGAGHTGAHPGTAFYASVSGASAFGQQVALAQPLPRTANAILAGTSNNGATSAALFSNGLQFYSAASNAATVAADHPNTIHRLLWNGWWGGATGTIAYRDILNTQDLPDNGEFQTRYVAGGKAYVIESHRQAAAYRPVEQYNAMWNLQLAQTNEESGGAGALRQAYRIAPTRGTTITEATNRYNAFAHYVNGYDQHAILANVVLWTAAGVRNSGATTGNSWAGFGTIAGPQGGTQSVVYTSGRVAGPHHFIGAPSRATGLGGVPTSPQESILTLWESTGGDSRARFGLGLPQGTTEPAGLAVGELWVDDTGVVHCKL